MPRNIPLTRIIQSSIPIRYDPRVVVRPCEPDRVPYLPVEILYQIAKALPQPKQIFNLAMANKGTWEYLQPALYGCEVTYEARLAHKYGGGSSTRLGEHYEYEIRGEGVHFGHLDFGSLSHLGSDYDSESEGEEDTRTASATRRSAQGNNVTMPERATPCPCGICDRRINLDYRVFEAPMPQDSEQFNVTGAMTALHWASIQGASALPVARKAIRAALAHHQPSYISGVDLIKRYYRERDDDAVSLLVPVDLPPPLFLAVAHGNLELCRELIYAGAKVNLLRGQSRCGNRYREREGLREVRQRPVMSFKVHEECVDAMFRRQAACVCNWGDNYFTFRVCHTVGHVAIDFGRIEILAFLLQNGLDVQNGALSLIHYAVVCGNMAAVKAVLDHDPSLVNSRLEGRTPMHFVPFMRGLDGRDVRDGPLRDMVSYLLERGAVLDAPGERSHDVFISTGQSPLASAIQIGLAAGMRGQAIPLFESPQIFTVLHAAEVLINFGAEWPIILDTLLRMIILVEPQSNLRYSRGRMTSSERTVYREIRKAWGQICKTIIAPLTLGNSTDNRSNFEAAITAEFVNMVNFAYSSCSSVGWCALEAVGKLLLSTGIAPDEETMQKWERIMKRELEGAPGRSFKLINEAQGMDGDESDWALLLAGVSSGEPETD